MLLNLHGSIVILELRLEVAPEMNDFEAFVFLVGPEALSFFDWDMTRVIAEL